MYIKDVRRENMRALAQQVGGITYLAQKLSKSQSQVSQLIGKSPSKNIGDKIAAQVEDTFNKPRGWMDILHHHIEENTTAYELVKNSAPHRAVPVLNWQQYKDGNKMFAEFVKNKIYDNLIAANAKLGQHAFALTVKDVNVEEHEKWVFPGDAIMIVDPDSEIHDGAYILVQFENHQRLNLKQVKIEGKKLYIKAPQPNPISPSIITTENIAGVVRQIMIDLD